FYGLTGIGQLLLQRAPGSDALGRILGYLVRLTEPLRIDGALVPGWWVSHDPDPLLPTPGGHANFGIAHGITGPLALLAHAMRRGSSWKASSASSYRSALIWTFGAKTASPDRGSRSGSHGTTCALGG
ncbi:MAG: hypothetical protein ACRDTD_21700, partial [Pseudonocardiaceae bacterium]